MSRSGESPTVLQQLWADHRVSAQLLRVLRDRLDDASRGDRGALAIVRDVVRREREYGDTVHHAREELLFSRLASRHASGADAVAGLTHDHDELARHGATLLESVEAWLAGGDEDGELLRQRGAGYADALGNHMLKEERRVFPLATQWLTDEDWRLVADAFAGRTDPLTPPAAPAFRDLARWLEARGERVYGEPGVAPPGAGSG